MDWDLLAQEVNFIWNGSQTTRIHSYIGGKHAKDLEGERKSCTSMHWTPWQATCKPTPPRPYLAHWAMLCSCSYRLEHPENIPDGSSYARGASWHLSPFLSNRKLLLHFLKREMLSTSLCSSDFNSLRPLIWELLILRNIRYDKEHHKNVP